MQYGLINRLHAELTDTGDLTSYKKTIAIGIVSERME